ncbi:hypothetical protein AAF712_016402 [Marasmius tenuissimus]|uniref:Uncharacterized protein n=1 Tax=Marasmius tenuissimus TaxID=585030 RepID=A0ABR2Z7J9_9AGAR
MVKKPVKKEAAPLPLGTSATSVSRDKVATVSSEDWPCETQKPIKIFQLPPSFDHDALVEHAECEQELSDTSIAADLSTSAHTASGRPVPEPRYPDSQPSPVADRHSATALPVDSAPAEPKMSHNHWKWKNQCIGKRKTDAESADAAGSPSQRTIEEAIHTAKAIRLNTDAADLDAAKGAHSGKPGGKKTFGSKEEKEKEYTLQELINLGYVHIPWDGIHPLLIVDFKGRIVAFLAGRPNRSDFVEEMMAIFESMMEISERMDWTQDLDENHKRGKFHAYNCRVTMGMGSQTPVVLSNGKEIDGILGQLVLHPALLRLNGYHNRVVQLWEPKLHAEYKKTVEAMYDKLRHLTRNFTRSIFTAAAFNFGG